MMKATMIGVAPPPTGAVAPPPGAAPPPAAAPGPQFGGFGQAPPPPAGVGATVPDPVNPLAGTFVADPNAVASYMGGQGPAPQPAHPPMGGPPPQMGAPMGGPPPQMGAPMGGPMGGPPPQMGAPMGGPMGGPPPQMGAPMGGPMGGPPPQMGAPMGGPMGGPPPQMGAPMGGPQQMAPGGWQPQPGGIQPGGPQGYPMGGPPMGGGGMGPIGTVRNPIMVAVISYFCFIYMIIVLFGMLNELKAFRRRDDINPIMFFIPILGLLEMLKLPEKVLEAKRMAGVPNAQVVHPVLYLFLWIYFMPLDLNEIWQAASRQAGGALPPGPR